MDNGLIFLAALFTFVGVFTLVLVFDVYFGSKATTEEETPLSEKTCAVEEQKSPAQPEAPKPKQALEFQHKPKPPAPEEPKANSFDERSDARKVDFTGLAYIGDGDSLTIKKTEIRLFGIDAPELMHPYGQKAKWALVKLCKGKKIDVVIDHQDHYGRTVAKCYLPDGRDLSAEMVKLGLAIDWPKFSKGAYKAYETKGLRKKLWLADARQKGHMHVWHEYEDRNKRRARGQTSMSAAEQYGYAC